MAFSCTVAPGNPFRFSAKSSKKRFSNRGAKSVAVKGPIKGAEVGPAAKNSLAIRSAVAMAARSHVSVRPKSTMFSAGTTASFCWHRLSRSLKPMALGM
eukprot:Skav203826  [mRNA]  locus=scaffold505:230662:236570:+ [translate_table: standard]